MDKSTFFTVVMPQMLVDTCAEPRMLKRSGLQCVLSRQLVSVCFIDLVSVASLAEIHCNWQEL